MKGNRFGHVAIFWRDNNYISRWHQEIDALRGALMSARRRCNYSVMPSSARATLWHRPVALAECVLRKLAWTLSNGDDYSSRHCLDRWGQRETVFNVARTPLKNVPSTWSEQPAARQDRARLKRWRLRKRSAAEVDVCRSSFDFGTNFTPKACSTFRIVVSAGLPPSLKER